MSVVPQGAESPTVPTDTAYAPKVVCENLVQQCRWRSIQFYIEVPELADPGLYDLEVSFTDPDGNQVTDYVMEEALNVIKVEFVDKNDYLLEALVSESGAALYAVYQTDETYDGKQFWVKVTDQVYDENDMWCVAESLDSGHGNWAKERKGLKLTKEPDGRFVSKPIILYDDIVPDVKAHFEAPAQGYEVMPASNFVVSLLDDIWRGLTEVLLVEMLGHEAAFNNAKVADITKAAYWYQLMFGLSSSSVSEYLPGYARSRPEVSVGTTFGSPDYRGQRMHLRLMGVGTASGIDEVVFKIAGTTTLPGFCFSSSDPKVEGAGKDDDYSFKELSNYREETGTVFETSAWVPFWCKDYGGKCTVEADLKRKGVTVLTTAAVTIPLDADGDGMSDTWENNELGPSGEWNRQYGTSEDGSRTTLLELDDWDSMQPMTSDLEPRDTKSYDALVADNALHKEAGDGIPLFTEYRGVILDGGGHWPGRRAHAGGHTRLSPVYKELMVEVDGMSGLDNQPDRQTYAMILDDVAAAISHHDPDPAVPDHGAGIRLYYIIDELDLEHNLFNANANKTNSTALKSYLIAHRNPALRMESLCPSVYMVFGDEVTDPATDSFDDVYGLQIANHGGFVWVDRIHRDSVAGGWGLGVWVEILKSTFAHELTHKFVRDPGTDGAGHFDDPDGDGTPNDETDSGYLLYKGTEPHTVDRMQFLWWGNTIRRLIDLHGQSFE